jgi:hypothetical protein
MVPLSPRTDAHVRRRVARAPGRRKADERRMQVLALGLERRGERCELGLLRARISAFRGEIRRFRRISV